MTQRGRNTVRTVIALATTVVLAMAGLSPALAQEGGTLVDDQTYETVGGAEITWSDAWSTLADFYGYDEDTGTDYVYLEYEGSGSHKVNILEYAGGDADLDEIVEGNREIVYEPPFGDLLMDEETDEGLDILFTGNDGEGPPEVAFFSHTWTADTGDIYVLVTSSPIADFPEVLAAIEDGIELDGESVLDGVDVDAVIATLERNEPIDPPASDPGEDQGADTDTAAGYLDDVQGDLDDWTEAYDAFVEVLETPGFADDDDLVAILEESLDTFVEAPDIAAERDAPTGLDDVHDAYLAYADGLAEIDATLDAYFATAEDSPEADEAWEAFNDAIDAAPDLAADVQRAIDAA